MYPDGSARDCLAACRRRHFAVRRSAGAYFGAFALGGSEAGVHLVTQPDCNVYANGPYLVLHGSHNGPLELDTGAAGTIHDFMSGETIGPGWTINLASHERRYTGCWSSWVKNRSRNLRSRCRVPARTDTLRGPVEAASVLPR